jgi:Uma2 family endonuclease
MTIAEPIKRYTLREYYRLERQSEQRHEYFEGEIFAMAGGTEEHSIVVMNLIGELRQRLKGKPCGPRDPNMRLKVKVTRLCTYPDVSVYCGDTEFDTEDEIADTATNPTLITEVLSKSTEGYDRGFKFENYRQIESLRTYVLVAQDTPLAETYERQADGSWHYTEFKGLDAVVRLPTIGVELPLREVYDRVKFPEAASRFPRLEERC